MGDETGKAKGGTPAADEGYTENPHYRRTKSDRNTDDSENDYQEEPSYSGKC